MTYFLKFLAFASFLLVALAVELSEDEFFKGTKEEFNEYLKKLHKQIDVSGSRLEPEQLRIRDDMEKLLAGIKKIDSCFDFILEQKGSTVEGLKIGFPDEFDFALVNPKWTGKIVLLESEDAPAGFGYAVDKNRKTCLKDDYLVEGENYVDPGRVRKTLRNLVEEAMRSLKMDGRIKDQPNYRKAKEQGPAVTFEEITPHDKRYPLISIDLAIAIDLKKWPKSARKLKSKIRRANAQLVPKVLRGENAHVWQISFSKTEARILRDIDRDGGCRKKVLQLVKHLKSRSIGQGFSLASYHLKMEMIIIHLNAELPQREDWTEDKLADRFMDLVNRILGSLELGSLPSYFIEGYDIYKGKPDLDSARKSLRQAIEKMKEDPDSLLPKNDRPVPRYKTHYHNKKQKKPYYILNI